MNYFSKYPIHQDIRLPSAGHKSGAHLAWKSWLAGVRHGINDHVTQADTYFHWGTGAEFCQVQIISDIPLPILTCYYFWFRGIFPPPGHQNLHNGECYPFYTLIILQSSQPTDRHQRAVICPQQLVQSVGHDLLSKYAKPVVCSSGMIFEMKSIDKFSPFFFPSRTQHVLPQANCYSVVSQRNATHYKSLEC